MLRQEGKRIVISDLRMGQEPIYTFSFAVAERRNRAEPLDRPVQVGARPDLKRALPWLWRRMQGQTLAPPR